MINFLVAFCCASSLFQVVILSSVNEITKGIGDLALQAVDEATGSYNVENYNKMDYRIVMSLALSDARDGLVKFIVHGKLVSLPTKGLSDSSAEELAKALNLGTRYRVHLYASDHFRFYIL